MLFIFYGPTADIYFKLQRSIIYKLFQFKLMYLHSVWLKIPFLVKSEKVYILYSFF